ncbi:MAG: hypothetical protein ABF449_11535 [Ethanoligenens sp.]
MMNFKKWNVPYFKSTTISALDEDEFDDMKIKVSAQLDEVIGRKISDFEEEVRIHMRKIYSE